METFITFHDVQQRIQNHPDFSHADKKKLADRVTFTRFKDVANQSNTKQTFHNTRQSNNGKKRLQPRSSN